MSATRVSNSRFGLEPDWTCFFGLVSGLQEPYWTQNLGLLVGVCGWLYGRRSLLLTWAGMGGGTHWTHQHRHTPDFAWGLHTHTAPFSFLVRPPHFISFHHFIQSYHIVATKACSEHQYRKMFAMLAQLLLTDRWHWRVDASGGTVWSTCDSVLCGRRGCDTMAQCNVERSLGELLAGYDGWMMMMKKICGRRASTGLSYYLPRHDLPSLSRWQHLSSRGIARK